jgi:hypothetical protein
LGSVGFQAEESPLTTAINSSMLLMTRVTFISSNPLPSRFIAASEIAFEPMVRMPRDTARAARHFDITPEKSEPSSDDEGYPAY